MAEQTDPILDYTQRLKTVFEGMREPFEAYNRALSKHRNIEHSLFLLGKDSLQLNEGQIPTLPDSLEEAILGMSYEYNEESYKVEVISCSAFGRKLLVSESFYKELKPIAETMLADESANYNVTLADEPTAGSTNRILVKYSGTDESSGTPLRAIMGFTRELLRRYFESKDVDVTDFDLGPLYNKKKEDADEELKRAEKVLTAYCGVQLGETAKDRIVSTARFSRFSFSDTRDAYVGIIQCLNLVDNIADVVTTDRYFSDGNGLLFTLDKLRESWDMEGLNDWRSANFIDNKTTTQSKTNANTVRYHADRDLLPLMKGLEIAVNKDDNQGVYRRMARLYIALKDSLPVLNGNNELQQYCNRQANVFIQKLTNF